MGWIKSPRIETTASRDSGAVVHSVINSTIDSSFPDMKKYKTYNIKSTKPLKMSHKLILQAVEPFTTQIEETKWLEQHLRSYCSSAFLTASLCSASLLKPLNRQYNSNLNNLFIDQTHFFRNLDQEIN